MTNICEQAKNDFIQIQNTYQRIKNVFENLQQSYDQDLEQIKEAVQKLDKKIQSFKHFLLKKIGTYLKDAFFDTQTEGDINLSFAIKGDKIVILSINANRLGITFRKNFPYKILNFIETMKYDGYITILGEALPGLQIPQKIKILYLPNLKTAKGIKFNDELICLDVPSLETTEGLESNNFSNLKIIGLRGIENLEDLDLTLFPNLKHLGLNGLENAQGLNLTHVPKLTSLYLNKVKSLKNVDLSSWSNLNTIDLSGLENVEGLDLQILQNLQEIFLSNLPIDQIEILLQKCTQQGLEGIAFYFSKQKVNPLQQQEIKQKYRNFSIIFS